MAFLSAEVSTIIGSQSLKKRAAAWKRLNAGAPHVPPRSRDAVRRLAVSVLALPSVPGPRTPFRDSAFRHGFRPASLTQRRQNQGKTCRCIFVRLAIAGRKPRSLPALPAVPSKIVVSDQGQTMGAILDDGVSVALNFGGDWIPIPGASTGCLAIMDRVSGDPNHPTEGKAAVPRPDGSIEIFRADRPGEPSDCAREGPRRRSAGRSTAANFTRLAASAARARPRL